MIRWCLWCGTELPRREDGRRTRRYCCNSHKQLAYIERRFPNKVERDAFNAEHMRQIRRRKRFRV